MSADSIQLRLARMRDAPGIARMSRDLIESGLGWTYDDTRIARLIGDAETSALVACETGHCEGGQLLGFAIMQFIDERAHLVLLAVRPHSRRRGVARRLLGWLLESARVAGIAELSLELRAGNAGARAFYLAMGFTDAGLLPGYYRRREPALRMRRVLRGSDRGATTWQAPTLRRP